MRPQSIWRNSFATCFKVRRMILKIDRTLKGDVALMNIDYVLENLKADSKRRKASSIEIRKIGITKLDTNAVVNAANTGLHEGGGVCGYIFHDAGSKEMTAACRKIGHCDEGSAVITPGFKLPAKYVIHAVGPRRYGGEHNEPKLLYSAYKQSLLLAKENGLHLYLCSFY